MQQRVAGWESNLWLLPGAWSRLLWPTAFSHKIMTVVKFWLKTPVFICTWTQTSSRSSEMFQLEEYSCLWSRGHIKWFVLNVARLHNEPSPPPSSSLWFSSERFLAIWDNSQEVVSIPLSLEHHKHVSELVSFFFRTLPPPWHQQTCLKPLKWTVNLNIIVKYWVTRSPWRQNYDLLQQKTYGWSFIEFYGQITGSTSQEMYNITQISLFLPQSPCWWCHFLSRTTAIVLCRKWTAVCSSLWGSWGQTESDAAGRVEIKMVCCVHEVLFWGCRLLFSFIFITSCHYH